MSESDRPGDEATGVPAAGTVDTPHGDTLGETGRRHWRQSTISRDGLDDRSDVFFAAIEMTRMPMILTDPRQADNPVVFANNAFLDLTGYENGEILGRNCRFLQGANTNQESVAELRRAVVAESATAVEILNYKRDGTPFWNAVFVAPVNGPDGELLYFFASQLDVTRRREAEEAHLHSQKLEAIGQLTAGVAHDFNNLLHIISTSVQRIEAKPDDAERRDRYLEAVRQASERGARLTKQLLAFARRSRLDASASNLSDLVADVAELLDTAAGPSIQLRLDLTRRLPMVRVDATHLEMAVLNLVQNARDAISGNGEIVVATRPVELNGEAAALDLDPGAYVALSITDNGRGMSEELQRRAVEPFYTTKPAGAGTGLGLAMAHGFMQQSGGRLDIDSAVGRGTTIRLLFPAGATDQPNELSEGTNDATSEPRAGHILVVDDERLIADMAAATLSDAGYAVSVAHDVDEALAQLRRASSDGAAFDLVFSDVVMPGPRDGLSLSRAIAAEWPALPVLLTTGYNDHMSVTGPAAEGLDVLGKPYKASELLDRVSNALRVGARQGERRETSDFGAATT